MTGLSHLNDYTIVFVNKRTKSNAEYFRTPLGKLDARKINKAFFKGKWRISLENFKQLFPFV